MRKTPRDFRFNKILNVSIGASSAISQQQNLA